MSIRSPIGRTQVRLEQVLYESRQAMRSAPDRNASEIIVLEDELF